MKKLLLVLLCLILTGCMNIRQEDLYTINVEGNTITVGYDDTSVINEYIDEYSVSTDNDKEVLDKVVIYINDLDNGLLSIDNTYITNSISETCSLLNGELTYNNGNVCLISKRVKKHDNYILIYGDILNDDLDKVDRIEVYFK